MITVTIEKITKTQKGNLYAKFAFTKPSACALLSDSKITGWNWCNPTAKVGDVAEISEEVFDSFKFTEQENKQGKFRTFSTI